MTLFLLHVEYPLLKFVNLCNPFKMKLACQKHLDLRDKHKREIHTAYILEVSETQSTHLYAFDWTQSLYHVRTRYLLSFLLVGIVITSDEREKTLTESFALLKTIFPDDAFYNSPTGPSVIMTDNCDELHQSLSQNWPEATLLLCTFHIHQQVWRWLYESCHGIAKDDRVVIMKLFRKIIYAKVLKNMSPVIRRSLKLPLQTNINFAKRQ